MTDVTATTGSLIGFPRRGKWLGGLDGAQMAGGCYVRPEPAQNDPAAEQDQGRPEIQASQLEGAAVQAGDATDGFAQHSSYTKRDDPRGEAAAEAVPDAVVEERPSDERV